jgi:phosphoribosyl-ATP pyrophosphohydrolase
MQANASVVPARQGTHRGGWGTDRGYNIKAMSTIEIKAFTTLREKLGEEATEVLMEYIGQKQASALSDDKARATFATGDRLRQVFATKEDLANTKVDILR